MPPEAAQMAAGFTAAPDPSFLQMAVYACAGMLVVLVLLTLLAVASLPVFFIALYAMEFGLLLVQNLPDPIGKLSKLGGLVFRSLRRNLLRTALTYTALFVLTGMLTMIYGVVKSIEDLTKEKEGSQLVILTEKFSIPSQMPPGYADQLRRIIETELPPEDRPQPMADNFMTWSFVGASLDPTKFTQENNMFLFALDPHAIECGMMSEQGLKPEDLGEAGWAELLRVMALVKEDKRNIVVGEDRLKLMNKRVGEEIRLYSTNYKDIELECRIVGAFPSGSRLGMAAAMRYDYLLAKLEDYQGKNGHPHPQAERCLNLVWVRMPSKASFERLAAVVNRPNAFAPAAKLETFSAAVGAFLEPMKDIIWGMKVIIIPAIAVIMCLVIGITITIGVRERWAEMAVLKVLGFRPWQVVGMVVSEAVLIGVFGGMLSTWCVYWLPVIVRWVAKQSGGTAGFFQNQKSYPEILLYGPLLGIVVGLIGSALPAWNARKVKVSEVFAQVT